MKLQAPNPHLSDFDWSMKMTVKMKNMGTCDIRALSGSVVFFDLFGDERMTIGITSDTEILRAGS